MQKQDNSGEAGSSLHTNQPANYGLLLTNIFLANILAMECMIRMWWTGNLAVLRSACGGLLPAPPKETQSGEAGGEEWESGREGNSRRGTTKDGNVVNEPFGGIGVALDSQSIRSRCRNLRCITGC
jgi:hypothetical protein